tara:strand:+ start:2675 stop:3610 length:936 start_codon:yes stop_codon:yes gene_type:complete
MPFMAALGPVLRAGAGMLASGGGTAAQTAGSVLSSQGMKQAVIQGVGQAALTGGIGGGGGNQMGGLLNIGASIKAGAARVAASPATASMDVMGAAADPRTAAVIKGGLDVFKDTVGTAAKALDPLAMMNPKNWVEIGQAVMGLPNKMAKLGDAAIAAAKELAAFSGAMGEAAIEQIFGDLRRNIEKAQQTGESTLSLTRSTETLKDGLAPLQNAITNVTNYLLQMGIEMITAMLPYLEWLFGLLKWALGMMLKALAEIVDWLDGVGEGQITKALKRAADSIDKVELNTRKEDSRGPLEVLLQDIAAGGLIQ